MRRMKKMKRLISLFLLAAMLLTMAGCSMERTGGSSTRATRASEETQEQTQEQIQEQTSKAAEGTESRQTATTWSPETDPVIREHIAALKGLKEEKTIRRASHLDLYVENTEAMAGFLSSNGITEYVQSVQALFDAMDGSYSSTAHYLINGSSGLHWISSAVNNAFRQDVQSLAFYKDNLFPEESALGQLFENATPFAEDSLTLIVSGFVEPRFDLSPLSRGIEQYFGNYPDSAACIVGIHSGFNGGMSRDAQKLIGTDLVIPSDNASYHVPSFYVRDFIGTLPVYIVMVGPETDVQKFLATYEKQLTTAGVEYTKSLYTNNVYDQIVEAPLEFEVIPDQKAGKLAPPVLSSYNTGELNQLESRTVFSATYVGIEARDERSRGGSGEEDPVEIRTSTQISAISTNYVPGAEYTFDYCLYTFDKDTQTWVEAGKNAQAMVHFTHEIMTGEVSEVVENKDVVVLASSREGIYLSALLDFSPESALSRDTVYRLEVRVKLNHPNYDARSEANPNLAKEFSISSSQYYQVVNSLVALYPPHRQWRATEADLTATAMPYTPNLSAFLTSLELLESSFRPDTEYVEYLDFIFNLGDGNRR